MRRRDEVLGKNNWEVVKAARRGHDVRGTPFEISLNRVRGEPLKL
jgi:hypothetical protein